MTTMLKKKRVGKSINGDIPKEEEKIASRRAMRLAKKVGVVRRGLRLGQDWLGDGGINPIDLGLILLLNLYLVMPFFGREAFVTSYSGPMIPFLAGIVAEVGLPMSYAIEIVNIVFFLMFPVSFYMLVKKVSGKSLVAFLSGLVVSLPASPFAGARVRAMFYSVEGPHMASLAIVPLAVMGLIAFLHNGGVKNLILAALSSALLALTSPFGLLTFLMFAGIGTFSEVLLGYGRLKISRALTVLALAGALCSFWYNPGFFWWLLVGPMGQEVRVMAARLIPISLFTLPVLGAFGYLLFDRKPDLQPLFLASFLTVAFSVIILAGRGFVLSAPSRYIPELGMSLAFLLGVGVEGLWEFLLENGGRWEWSRWRGGNLVRGLMLLVIGLMIAGIVMGRNGLLSQTQVLGFWSRVERGEIWKARERFSGFYNVLGYLITITAGGILGYMIKQSGKKLS